MGTVSIATFIIIMTRADVTIIIVTLISSFFFSFFQACSLMVQFFHYLPILFLKRTNFLESLHLIATRVKKLKL